MLYKILLSLIFSASLMFSQTTVEGDVSGRIEYESEVVEYSLDVFPPNRILAEPKLSLDYLNSNASFETIIAYNEGMDSYSSFGFNTSDSLAVWYRPVTSAKVLGANIYFRSTTELIGQDVTMVLRSINDGNEDQWNGNYDFTIDCGEFWGQDILESDGSSFNGFSLLSKYKP